MTKKYHYHYYAMYQMKNGSICHLDGLASLKNSIIDEDSYSILIKSIVKSEEEGANITICSLTLLGDTEEDDQD